MNFKEALKNHILNHNELELVDILKFTYQATFGMEHLINDVDKVKEYFYEEYDNTSKVDIPLYEELNEDFVRVNLGAWKNANLKKEWLFNMFINSSKIECQHSINENLEIARSVILDSNLNFDINKWDELIKEYLKSDSKPVHHSKTYREKYVPSYRVVNKKYLITLPILKKINKDNYIISIEGRAASGKTYLSSLLEEILDITSIKMDHFFLPLNLRTEDRFNEVGGNVDYDRFILEVLPNLKDDKEFSYNVFDCKTKSINDKRLIKGNGIKVIEGSYSSHPKFGNYSDLKVFLTVDYETQLKRIKARNGEFMLNRFINEWIPLEEKYFETLNMNDFLIL